MTNSALQVNNLSAQLGDFALKDVNLALKTGTIMGLVGRNGAGKTTLIKTIVEHLPRKSGEVFFFGLPLMGNETTVKARLGIVFDTPIYPPNLKPVVIKKMLAPLYQGFDDTKYTAFLERFELDPGKKLATYSKGMQMKFSIAIALAHNPDLIILDEPTAGLDPIARVEIVDLLMEIMQSEQKSILFSTHITSDLEKIADYLTIIDQGKIIISEAKDELLEQYALVQIDKQMMNDKLVATLIGAKETAFGYTGLCRREQLAGMADIKLARPTIEDLLIYYREGVRL